jgi:hypothetical protein
VNLTRPNALAVSDSLVAVPWVRTSDERKVDIIHRYEHNEGVDDVGYSRDLAVKSQRKRGDREERTKERAQVIVWYYVYIYIYIYIVLRN